MTNEEEAELRAEVERLKAALHYARGHVRSGKNSGSWWNDPRCWRVDHEIERALAGEKNWRLSDYNRSRYPNLKQDETGEIVYR
jgi:hypothetical protein